MTLKKYSIRTNIVTKNTEIETSLTSSTDYYFHFFLDFCGFRPRVQFKRQPERIRNTRTFKLRLLEGHLARTTAKKLK